MSPKVSELLRAAGRGCLRPYGGDINQAYQGSQQGFGGASQMFDSREYEQAKRMAGIFDAMADVYERIEKEQP